MKKILLSFIAMLFMMPCVFAGGANEARLYYMPRNVVNNKNVMIELTSQKSLGTVADEYANTSTDNLNLFRLRDTLYKDDHANVVVVTISSENNWLFVNEDNPTVTRPFELQAFCVERQFNRGGGLLNHYRDYNTISIVELEESTSLTYSKAVSCFKYNNGNYELHLNTTDFTLDGLSLYAAYIRDYDVCVKLKDAYTNLEAGYYSTTITVTVSQYQERDTYLNKDGGLKTMSETITIRGCVGIDPGSGTGSYSFSVSSAADTYTMNLKDAEASTVFDIAKVGFYYTEIVTKDEPDADTNSNRFKVYISPGSNYQDNGTYMFVRMGSENQARTAENTIYYDLCYVDDPGSALVAASSPAGNKTYVLTPDYTQKQISSQGLGGGSDQWKPTWSLDKEIGLKLDSDSISSVHSSGLYYSYVYFTLEYN